MAQNTLLIIGASARAAAEAAVGSGFEVIAADLFADCDLQQVAQTIRIEDYPRGFVSAIENLVRDHGRLPVVYTGALENYPDLIDEIEQISALYGNFAGTVRRVRDPFELRRVLGDHNFAFPDIHNSTDATTLDPTKRWLWKPRRSAGGQGVALVSLPPQGNRGESPNDYVASPTDSYFQEFVDGTVCSASYVFDPAANPVSQLVGVTEMLVGCEWLGVDGFRYCGSITRAPAELEYLLWVRLGEILAQQFHLRGLCGVDAVLCDGNVFPIEVNPRYTASMELFDLSHRTLMKRHVRAFQGLSSTPVDLPSVDLPPVPHYVGKCIVFAKEDITFPNDWRHLQSNNVRFADIPPPQRIPAGQPILTMIAQAASRDALWTKLRDASEQLYARLRQH